LLETCFLGTNQRRHPSYPVVDEHGDLLGVVTRANLLEEWVVAWLRRTDRIQALEASPVITYDLINREPITIYPLESARGAAERMAEQGVGRLVVVSPDNPRKPIAIVTRSDLLKPRARMVEAENRRERILNGFAFRRKTSAPS